MGLSASQAMMLALVARKADQELTLKYFTQVRISLADMVTAVSQLTDPAFGLPIASPIEEINTHMVSARRHEAMARMAKLKAADDILAKKCHNIEEEQEAVQEEIEKTLNDVAANISTSFQLMDSCNHNMSLNHRRAQQLLSDVPSDNSSLSSPSGIELHATLESSRPPCRVENPQQCSVDPPEVTPLIQPSEPLPLWRCVCWHIWFCVLSTTTGSCIFGVVWSTIYASISDAFTVASYMLAAGTLVSGVLMFKHNEACVQRAQRRRRESQDEHIRWLTLNGRSG